MTMCCRCEQRKAKRTLTEGLASLLNLRGGSRVCLLCHQEVLKIASTVGRKDT